MALSPSEAVKRSREKNPEKYAARTAMTHALRSGKLVRKACEVCGSVESEGHHEDYSRPLDVRWLCRDHHLAAHGGRFGDEPPMPEDYRKSDRHRPGYWAEYGRKRRAKEREAGTMGGAMNVDPIKALKFEVRGNQAAWARKHGFRPAYVSDVINGRRDPGKAILEALGLERVVTYRVKGDEK